MKRYLYSLLLVTFFFISCVNSPIYTNENIGKGQQIDSLCLSYLYAVNISLDNETPIDWLNTSLIEKNDSIYVLVFNTYIGDFFYYDARTGMSKGKMSTGLTDMDGMNVYNNQNIYVHDYEKCVFYSLNDSGDVCDTLKVTFFEGKNIAPPSRISIFNGVNFENNKLYYTTFSVGEGDKGERFCGSILDFENNKETYIIPYPKVYQMANWGGSMYRLGCTCFNTLQKLFLFSFPASHYLYVYDMKKNVTESFYAGSKFVKGISSYSNNIDEPFDDNESIRHYISNSSYGAIVYDKYRNLYYRVVEMPQKDGNDEFKNLKQLSIIILDESFNIVGETSFAEPYGSTILVTPDGLLIPFVEDADLDGTMCYHMYKVCVLGE